MRVRVLATAVAVALWGWSTMATEPGESTRRWWSHVRALAHDDLQGRDTGSGGYRKAARYVVAQFSRAGLEPAGDSGYYQRVPLHRVRFHADRSSVLLRRADGDRLRLRWQQQIAVVPRTGLPRQFEAPLVFNGWEIPPEIDVRGKVLVALAPPRFVPGPRGYAQTPRPGYAGTLVIDSATGPEPVRWPALFSSVMTPIEVPLPAHSHGDALRFSFNPVNAEDLFKGSGHTYAEMRALADAGARLPSFPLAATLSGTMRLDTTDLIAENIIAVLPGVDPTLASEYVVVSAHLDGFGVGEPVNGDRIYNGALDDAAYVATLIELADRLKGHGVKRSVLFCVFTAEEKGLLGSRYFTAHPTVPKERMAANINLDILRPIFPLRSLTTLGLDDSTLGDAARRVGEAMGIRIKADPEPERDLIRRSDQWNFLQAGVPSLAFVFGYEPGSTDEATYRRWYAERYHSPSDDLNQPWDPTAAALFNDFFVALVETVANDVSRPTWKPGSAFDARAK